MRVDMLIKNNKQAGFTLLELVIIIVSIIIFGVIAISLIN